MIETTRFNWRDRLRAAGIHFGISAIIAALSALFVFLVLYPGPYRELSGGRDLYLILVSVDVVLGPLITFAIFNRAKAWPVLRRDLVFVGLAQLVALGYGLWTVYIARPVHLVFEYDSFRVVHAIEIPQSLIEKAPPELRALPVFGVTMLALRPFHDADERLDTTMAALEGLPLSARPELWEAYADARARVLQAAKPLAALKKRLPGNVTEIDRAVARSAVPPEKIVYLPLVGRKSFWTVLLDASTAEVIGYLPLDPF